MIRLSTLPAPDVDGLVGDYFDLRQLGSDDIVTYINYPGLDENDFIYIEWRGRAPDGSVQDYVYEGSGKTFYEAGSGFKITITNGLATALNHGQVMYSYKKKLGGDPQYSDESYRLFFRISDVAVAQSELPAVHIREAQGNWLDWQAATSGITLVASPYQAMMPGDIVTLNWKGYSSAGSLINTKTPTFQITATDEIIHWNLFNSDVLPIKDGYALVSYHVTYASGDQGRASFERRFEITAASEAPLPAPGIEGHSAGDLDPDTFPGGVPVLLEPWPGMLVGDYAAVYGKPQSPTDAALYAWVRIDPSSMEQAKVRVVLPQHWFLTQDSRTVDLTYQYSREGAGAGSAALNMDVRRQLKLPAPIVTKAGDDGPGRGKLFAADVIAGVEICIPDDAVIGGATIVMHWDGYGITGKAEAGPDSVNPRLFRIPASAVPANMRTAPVPDADRVKVFYSAATLTEHGLIAGQNSETLLVGVVKPELDSVPLISCPEATAGNSELFLSSFSGNPTLKLGRWPFFAGGQTISLWMTHSGPSGPYYVIRDQETTGDEPEFSGTVSRSFLQSLPLGEQLTFHAQVIFEPGLEPVQRRSLSLTLRD